MPQRFYHLKKWSILFFCCSYLTIQVVAIVHAHFSEDKRFGFWMFAESSQFQAKLYRQLKDGTFVYAPKGTWVLHHAEGQTTEYAWDSMVRDFRLYQLEELKRAKTGMYVTLKYLQYALNYVADHTPQDTETVRFLLKIKYKRAQGEWEEVFFESHNRDEVL